MESKAITQANTTIDYAKSAVALMQKNDLPENERIKAWTDFLNYFYIVYEKLRAGSANSQKSKVWYEAKVVERDSDPLLHYTHLARGAVTHGLEVSHKVLRYKLAIVEDEETKRARKAALAADKRPTWKIRLPTLVLDNLNNRKEGSVSLPTSHLGQSVRGQRPQDVAERALSYLEALVNEARSLSP